MLIMHDDVDSQLNVGRSQTSTFYIQQCHAIETRSWLDLPDLVYTPYIIVDMVISTHNLISVDPPSGNAI